ncbi:DUF3303 domain-containing protein [Rhodohalobacter sp. 614A]|uniref:DUF3303 domain-containing protein n=1 Tax=Rhodohalobacter sp. 614A TaxID=2908649 RepID=UPI001F17E34C|nr:DUF3303 family protein [Rhodohalobacter sp. 614A]
MTYMIIETFKPGQVNEIYKRLEEKGRMQPEGLTYIHSWIDENMEKCYQVMETDSEEKIHQWISNWDDVMEFKIVPVISSEEAKNKALS